MTAAAAAAEEEKEKESEKASSSEEKEEKSEGVFIGVKDIVASFVGRGCGCRLLHKCLSTEDEGYHVSVFEITPPPPPPPSS